MPNCDFYAIGGDVTNVLGFVFASLRVRVFESFSEPGSELREFHAPDEVMSSFNLAAPTTALLELWPTEASANVVKTRINLGPVGSSEGPFRERLEGWGLIQLHLGGRDGANILPSHTNHNTEHRATAWKRTGHPQLGHPNKWDWAEVTRVSAKLNRYIRKVAISKHGSRPVLPEAHVAIERGCHAL